MATRDNADNQVFDFLDSQPTPVEDPGASRDTLVDMEPPVECRATEVEMPAAPEHVQREVPGTSPGYPEVEMPAFSVEPDPGFDEPLELWAGVPGEVIEAPAPEQVEPRAPRPETPAPASPVIVNHRREASVSTGTMRRPRPSRGRHFGTARLKPVARLDAHAYVFIAGVTLGLVAVAGLAWSWS